MHPLHLAYNVFCKLTKDRSHFQFILIFLTSRLKRQVRLHITETHTMHNHKEEDKKILDKNKHTRKIKNK